MTTVQDALNVLRETAPMLDADEDYITITAFEQLAQDRKAARKKELDEAQATLQNLVHTLNQAKLSATRPATVPTVQQHLVAMDQVEQSKMSLAKAINDTEGVLSTKQAELASLKEEARSLEARDIAAEHENELNGHVLRLKVYSGLGFEPIIDKDGTAAKILIKTASGDVRSEDIREVNPQVDLTEKLWKLASS